MNDCLITKLKGSVSTDLPKLGECRFKVTNGQILLSVPSSATPLTIEGKAGVLLDGSATKTITSGGWTSPIVISGLSDDVTTGEISIPNKYASIRAIIAPMSGLVDLSPFGGMEGLREFCFSGFANVRATDATIASIAEIVTKFPSLTSFACGGGGANGNVLDLLPLAATLTTLNGANMEGIKQSNIKGDFANLGLLPNLTNIGTFLTNSKVTGTVEGFVANRLSVTPNTAGSIQVKWLGEQGRITYQGETIENVNNNTISWDAQGNITITH